MINIYNVKHTKNPDLIDCVYTDVIHGDIPTTVDMVNDQRKPLVQAVLEYDGVIEEYKEPVIIITNEEKIHAIKKTVQYMLDSKALQKGYDNINSCGKYCGYDNVFRAECEMFGGWAADCWAKCYELLSEWKAGQAGELTPAEVLEVMPVCPVNV